MSNNDKMTPAPSPRGTNHENLWVRTSLIARDRLRWTSRPMTTPHR